MLMALWRDPLDELIGDLERALPPDTGHGSLGLPPIEDEQMLISAILYGTEENRARAYKEPRVQRVLRYYEELAARRGSSSEPGRQPTNPAVTPNERANLAACNDVHRYVLVTHLLA